MLPPDHEPFNPYAAPATAVSVDEDVALEPPYFAVGLLKLVVMCIFTLGLYELYWFYRQWEGVKRSHQAQLNAPLRAIFFPINAYGLFQRIALESRRLGISSAIQPLPLALGVLVIASLLRMPEPYWLLSLLGFLPLIPIQSAINEIHERLSPSADQNTGFSLLNLLLILPGLLILVPILITLIWRLA